MVGKNATDPIGQTVKFEILYYVIISYDIMPGRATPPFLEPHKFRLGLDYLQQAVTVVSVQNV